MHGPFKATFEEEGDIIHVAITGKMHGCLEFRELLYEPVNEYLDRGFRKFALDLSHVRFIDSIGVGFIHMAYASISNAQGHMAMFGMNERVLSLFHVVKLDLLYDTFATRAEAVAALTKS